MQHWCVKVRRESPGRTSPRVLRQFNSYKTADLRGGERMAIVQQAIAGNADAHEHLFTHQTGRLYRAASARLHNKEDAEDALQDGLCKAYTSLSSFQGRSSFSTWFTRIVTNSALMTRRKKSFHPDVSLDEILDRQPEQLPHGVVDVRPGPEKIFAAIEINALVEKHVSQLPPRLRTAYRLRDTNGLSAAESSRVLGIPASAVESQISRARRALVCGLQRTLGNRPAYRLNHGLNKMPHECYNEECLG